MMTKFKPVNGWTKTKIIERIRRQFKGKSVVTHPLNGEVCKYRGPNGKKCAIGMFIPDSKYKKSMDKGGGQGVESLIEDYPKIADILPLDREGCSEFQSVHDGLDDLYSVEEQKQALIFWVKQHVGR